MTLGQINGRSAEMVVDTGATSVAMSTVYAERLGVEFKTGQPVQMSTANGVIPGWRVKLGAVQSGRCHRTGSGCRGVQRQHAVCAAGQQLFDPLSDDADQ